MDGVAFDRLSRRLVLGGLAGGGIAMLFGGYESAAGKRKKKRPSPAKRCRRRKRVFCAGRCCPSGRRCQNGACVASCENPFSCGSGGIGGDCGGDDCFGCVETASGASACIAALNGDLCTDNEPCRSDGDCPGGTICVTCNCGGGPGGTADFRCVAPCASA